MTAVELNGFNALDSYCTIPGNSTAELIHPSQKRTHAIIAPLSRLFRTFIMTRPSIVIGMS